MNEPFVYKIELDVRGMSCEACERHVQHALQSVTGVQSVVVPGWQSGQADVIATSETNLDELITAVARAGYTATVRAVNSLSPQSASSLPDALNPDFDLIIVGGGSAGFAAAIRASELGASVAIINAGPIGGTCVNVGCVPSKTLIRAVGTYYQAGRHPFQGIQTVAGNLNWAQVIAQKEALVAELRQRKYVDVLKAYPQIKLIEGQARLGPQHEVYVDGKSLRYRKLILATGASPWIPPLPGLANTPYLTSTTALSLRELPRSLIVLGANAVGLELAQMFARAGTYVTVLEVMPSIAPFEDEDIRRTLAEYMVEEGLTLIADFHASEVTYQNGRFTLKGQQGGRVASFSAEQLLVATGRRPNTAGLELETVGIKPGERGEIPVNALLQTAHPDIFAAGDVIGRDMFVYVAAYAGSLAAENALTGAGRVYDTTTIPRVTFTDPQIASVGMTEAQARQAGLDIQTTLLPMQDVPRAFVA
ncbi:MAG: FAD-dependent oxidoreductase, partial [Thermanaerothrix sp.]|uniref:FAD-dependent oxidoreductase n=1 Tax=Thermanaerothrix sp. TaxID=2972675 RepID=UPI003C7ED4B3